MFLLNIQAYILHHLIPKSKFILYLETREIDPIQFYTLTTERTGGQEEDGEEYELDQFM